MPVTVEKVADRCHLGEGPHWDPQTHSLYYIDIFEKIIHKYTPATNTHAKATIATNHVSFIIPIEGAANRFLISAGREVVALTWDGVNDKISDLQKIAEVDTSEDVNKNRINDAKCDASGRLWFGTMGFEPEYGHITPNKGSLYSLDPNGQVKFHVGSISCSNGLAWNSDNTKMYYIDSPTREIYQFDFDLVTGTLNNKKVIFSFEEAGVEGFPDGQTIDTDGNLWVAVFNGYKVIKVDPRKRSSLLQTVDIPAKQVTSVAFGGDNFDELYVTSASFTIDGVELPPPHHGEVFRVTGLGIRGYPAANAKII